MSTTKKKPVAKTSQKPNKKAEKTTGKINPILERFEQQKIWHLVILVLLPFFLYIKTTGYLLINFDDVQIIINNLGFLSDIKNIGTIFKTDAFISAHGDYYRPLQTLTLMLDTIIGGGKPWIYHLSSLIYHILTVVSFYYLLRLLKINNLTALFAGLIFAIHPLLASSVSWIPARGDELIGLFGLLMFITFIKYLEKRKPVFFILHIFTFIFSIFSKETAILLPLILIFYFYKVAGFKIGKESLKELFPFLISWLTVFIIFYILRSKVVTGNPPDFIFGIKPFLYNLPAIPSIICKFVFPLFLSTMPLFNPAVTFIGSILLTIAVYLTVKAIRQNNWLTVMGFAWFILFIIPPMFFKLFYSKYLLEYYEHRSYLPLMGLVIVVAILLDQYRKKHNFPIIVSATILVIFTFLASAHSDNFKDSIAFFSNATDRGNPGACTKRGEMYFGQRDFTNAISDFNTAIDLSNGEYAPALFNKGLYESQVAKDHPAAENDFTRAIATDTTFIDAYIQRASERVFSNNFDGAINDLDIAKRLDSTRADIYYTKAKVFTSALKFKEALPYYNKSIAMNEYSAEMYNDRAYVKYRIKDFLGALKDCNKAISLMPNFMSAYYNKGVIYLETGKAALAVKEFDTTLALTNNFYFGYFYRGMAKKQLHDMKGACADWQESIQLGITREAPMVMDTINKYCK